MKIFYKTLLFMVFLWIGIGSYAQVPVSIDIPNDSTSNNVLYRKEKYGSIIVDNLGLGINYRSGKNLTAFKRRMFEIEFVTMRDPKQIKTINPYFLNSTSYVYGKLNDVFVLRSGIGFHKLLNSKPYWGGVELRYYYSGGVSLGLAKPIYLQITNYVSQGSYYNYYITTERYNPYEHFPFAVNVNGRTIDIYGKASFLKGINKIKFYPGIYGKFGFSFDFGSEDNSVKALELGTTIDVFPKAIPIMAFCKKRNLFLTIYFSFSFGKRYNP